MANIPKDTKLYETIKKKYIINILSIQHIEVAYWYKNIRKHT